jgi:cytoskeletal protein CcmA (bactofilin family)
VFKRRKPDETHPAEQNQAAELSDPLASPIPGLPPRPELAGGPRAADTGLGVPPFRPAPSKEAPAMSRTSFAPVPSAPPASATPLPGAAPARPAVGTMPGRGTFNEAAERRTLIVGRGISLQGTVQDAERLVVEGTVEATMIRAAELSVAQGGIFKGEIEVDEAEVAGTIDGTLTARHSLQVRATGKVLGTARCKRLQVEDGGQITGRIEMITDSGKPVENRPELAAVSARAEATG